MTNAPSNGRPKGGRAAPASAGEGRTASRGRRPKQAEAGDTREAILNASESLFAHLGFDGVTVRQVARAASVDPALLHYYFDSKRGLFDATFLRRAEILNRLRVASLAEYEQDAGQGASVEGCLRAFFRPMMQLWADGDIAWQDYFRLVALVNNTPHWGGETMGRFFDPAIQQLIAAFKRALPAALDEDLYWCWSFVSGALTLAFAQTGRIEHLSGGMCRSDDGAAIEARLAPFMAAGVEEICRRGAAQGPRQP